MVAGENVKPLFTIVCTVENARFTDKSKKEKSKDFFFIVEMFGRVMSSLTYSYLT